MLQPNADDQADVCVVLISEFDVRSDRQDIRQIYSVITRAVYKQILK